MTTRNLLDSEGVKAELRRRKISYNDIAATCGVSPSYVGKVILGMNNRWSGTTLKIKSAIALSIGVNIEELELSANTELIKDPPTLLLSTNIQPSEILSTN